MGGWLTPPPGPFTTGNSAVRIVQEARWAPASVRTGAKNLAAPILGIRSPARHTIWAIPTRGQIAVYRKLGRTSITAPLSSSSFGSLANWTPKSAAIIRLTGRDGASLSMLFDVFRQLFDLSEGCHNELWSRSRLTTQCHVTGNWCLQNEFKDPRLSQGNLVGPH